MVFILTFFKPQAAGGPREGGTNRGRQGGKHEEKKEEKKRKKLGSEGMWRVGSDERGF